MRFTCNKSELLTKLNICSKAISSKSPNPALEGFLITAADELKVTGYNTKLLITSSLPVSIEDKGECVLNAKLLTDIIKSLPGEEMSFSLEKNTVTVISSQSRYTIAAMNREDYPDIPDAITENNVTLPQKLLRELISRTVYACSLSNMKPTMTGCLFNFDSDDLTAVGIDNFRMAALIQPLDGINGQSFSFIVPSYALREIEKLLCDDEENATISFSNKNILFTVGATTLSTSLIAGEFFNYKRMLENEVAVSCVVSPAELLDSLSRVSIISDEKYQNLVKLEIDGAVIQLTSESAYATAYDECEHYAFSGEPITLGLNYSLLSDALKACSDEEKVELQLKSSVAPLVIRPTDGSKRFTHLILPIRLRTKPNEA